MNIYAIPESSKAIRYDLSNSGDGWQIAVLIPRRASSSDRTTVLNWLHDYQGKVKAEHPHWPTALRVNENGYTLHIWKADRPAEVLKACNLLSQGDVIRDCWSGTFDYAR